MANQRKYEKGKVFNPDFLTPQERQDRIVEILTRGVLRLIEKKRQASQSQGITPEISNGLTGKKCEEKSQESP
jgi:hypothetical protein